jgi:O-antigen/teichoic acid export membrane protein
VNALTHVRDMSRLASSPRMSTVLRGSAWTIVGYAASQLLRLAATLVLARQLLSPQAFGLVALVTVFLSGLEMLSDLGIGLDVVQHRRGDDPVFVNTAFLIQMARGTVLWAIATAFAYPFAYFYGQPAVFGLAVVGAFSVGVRGMASGSVWLMVRHVQLGRLTALNVSSEVAGFLVSVSWALISPTAWALIAGRLGAAVAFTVGSHLLAEHRVSLLWDRGAARQILVFGAGIFVSTATYFLCGEGERLLIGKFISMEELGCFSLALALSAAPARAIQQVAGQVFFPMIASSVRNDRRIATKHFRSARVVFLTLAIVLGVGFIAYGHRVVTILLPQKYAMTAWMLQLLGFRASQDVLAAPAVSLVLACGDTRYPAAANISRLVLMLSGVWFAFSQFGIHQAIAVVAFVPLVSNAILLFGASRELHTIRLFEATSFLLFLAATGAATIIPWPWR